MTIGEYWKVSTLKNGLDFEDDYGHIDYIGEVVIDIGAADHTPDFFLDKGAKLVIGYEPNPGEYSKLKEYEESHDNVIIFNECGTGVDSFENVLKTYVPGIVKFDCEGCEAVLYYINETILQIPHTYVIEYHQYNKSETRFEDFEFENIDKILVAKFESLGYQVVVSRERHKLGMITAIKR